MKKLIYILCLTVTIYLAITIKNKTASLAPNHPAEIKYNSKEIFLVENNQNIERTSIDLSPAQKSIVKNSINTEDLSSDELTRQFKETQYLVKKLSHCIFTNNQCPSSSTLRNGVNYTDEDNSIYHGMLEVSLSHLHQMLFHEESLSKNLDLNLYYKNLSIQNNSIPIKALNILLSHGRKIDIDAALENLKNIKGESKAKTFTLLSHFYEKEISLQVIETLSDRSDPMTAQIMLKYLQFMNLPEQKLIATLRSSCHLKLNDREFTAVKYQQDLLNMYELDMNPSELCN